MATERTYSARDLLANRKVIVDTVLPPLVFVGVNGYAGLRAAAVAALGLAALLVVVRLARRERLVYALSGLGGVSVGVGVALWAGEAEGFFLPGIVTNLAMGLASVVSILVRRPLIALTGAAIYRWPLAWYWHPRVRPAYSEITWAWAVVYLGKAAVQYWLVVRQEIGWLAVARIATGWPVFAALLVATYAYVTWRLERLGGPSVEEFRGLSTPSPNPRPSRQASGGRVRSRRGRGPRR
ncbi:hypothetical protein BH23ACT7_BH23ACT7_09100 [soil metagenome]